MHMATSPHLQDLISHRAVGEEGQHAFNALIGSFLIMVLGALDGVKEPVSVIRNALQNIVDPKERTDMRTARSVTFRCVHQADLGLTGASATSPRSGGSAAGDPGKVSAHRCRSTPPDAGPGSTEHTVNTRVHRYWTLLIPIARMDQTDTD